MGEVVVVEPMAETLHFVGDLGKSVANLLAAMKAAAELIIGAQSEADLLLHHEAFLSLQMELSKANVFVEQLAELAEQMHYDREVLRDILPNDQFVQLTVCNDDNRTAAVLVVKRNHARIECPAILLVRPAQFSRAG